MSLLTGQDAVSLALLVRGIARDLYRDTLRHGGWAAEIGDVGQALFVSDAERAVREADGVLWAIADGDADRRSATTS